MSFRNFLYDKNYLKSYVPPVASIVVGNLSTGGTGKTPHVEMIADLLLKDYKIAILSRGYGRITKGFIELNEMHTDSDVGDEPLQYFSKFQDKLVVSVCENRKTGIEQILENHPETNVILLDDAFQHRKIKAGYTILLSEFNRPFFKSFVLPAGNLREFRFGKKRADSCIYTKCPDKIDKITSLKYANKFDAKKLKNTYFSSIFYGDFEQFSGKQQKSIKHVLLVTGIANPTPLEMELKKKYKVKSIHFPDHHTFKPAEIKKIHEIFDKFAHESKIILTTEKDSMRLKNQSFSREMNQFPWFYIPIKVKVSREEQFKNEIINYVEQHQRSSSVHPK